MQSFLKKEDMGKSQYMIQFGGLPVGIHDYRFEIGDTFFKNIESSEVQSANIEIKAALTKQNNLLQMHFDISGTVKVDCDRCLKSFDYPLNTSENLVIKHGNPDDSTDDILVIPEGKEEFDVAHYLYEYITLALSARRVPCELDKKKYKCDDEVLAKLNSLSHNNETAAEEPSNPMWEQLNKLKFNKN